MEEPTRTIPSSYRATSYRASRNQASGLGSGQSGHGRSRIGQGGLGRSRIRHRTIVHWASGDRASGNGHRASGIGRSSPVESRTATIPSLLRKSHVTGGAIGYINYIKGHTLYMGIEHSKISKLSDMCRNEDIKGVIGNLMNFSQT